MDKYPKISKKSSHNDIIDWLNNINNNVVVNVEKIPFAQLDKWDFDKFTGNLCHESGGFFSIEGVNVKTNFGLPPEWDQPIINQPEVGFLGIIAKEIDGNIHFLMQAKIEPGNVNHVQISPTLQATKSNYTRVHKGKTSAYIEYFRSGKYPVLLDQLQSEQGARFLKKRNRNIIIKVNEEINHDENFYWLTLQDLKALMHFDNMVNMDTRTVISALPYIQGSYVKIHKGIMLNNSFNTIENIISWVTKMKTKFELETTRIPLNEVRNWEIDDCTIHHKKKKYFNIIATKVEIEGREVRHWFQPMVEPLQDGICVFIVKKLNDIYHFIIQAKVEPGNFDVIEMAPTVQCITDNYQQSGFSSLPFLDYVLNVDQDQIIYDAMQSEEGGRFYREQNRNMIVRVYDDFPNELPENYIWMSYSQIQTFLMFNNYLNIQARSLIAAVDFIND